MLAKRSSLTIDVWTRTPLLTNAGFGVISEVETRPTAALNFQVTQVITNLWTAAIIKLTQIRQGTCTKKLKQVELPIIAQCTKG